MALSTPTRTSLGERHGANAPTLLPRGNSLPGLFVLGTFWPPALIRNRTIPV